MARSERRADHLGDVLASIGAVEEELGERRERRGCGVEQQAADGRPGGRPAGLTGLDDRVSGGPQVLREEAEVGRLAGALDPLEGDEERHGRAFV